MTELHCAIKSIDYYNADTRRVVLALPDGQAVTFSAGQYLEIVLADKTCPFSIASAPSEDGLIELHIRPTPGSDDSQQIEHLLDTCTSVTIQMPKGNCYLTSAPENPLILIAASTGITQMKSIVEYLLPAGITQPVYLYWGVVADTDLYLQDLCRTWEADHPNFHFIPVISEPESSPEWEGRVGLVGEEALADFDDVSDVTVYVSGGPGMVYATLDAFVERGMPADHMASDIFSYAPRPKA